MIFLLTLVCSVFFFFVFSFFLSFPPGCNGEEKRGMLFRVAKKRRLSSEEEVLFGKYSIFELDGLDYCSSCKVEVPLNVKKLHEHLTSKSDANKLMIETLIPSFTKHGIARVVSHLFCVYHECEIQAKGQNTHRASGGTQ